MSAPQRASATIFQRVLLVLLASLLAGCSPLYLLRAAYGEAKILWRREPFERVLPREDLDPEWRRKIELVEETRTFARELDLDVGGSFGSLSWVDTEDTVFVLTAAEQTALESYVWWFPVVGTLPYKGFFSREQAEEAAARLEAEGYDTLVRTAAAFSTLGWFDDPLLRHLLGSDDVFLVDLVLHETYHRTFFLKGAAASAFNESVASFVGHRGAIEFFASRGGAAARLAQAEERWADARRFARFMRALVTRLETLYAGDDEDAIRAEREVVFAEAVTAFGEIPFAGRRYERFAEMELNNAVVLHYRMYASELDLFEQLWQSTGGLRPALDRIEAAARAEPDEPLAGVRAALAPPAGATPP